MAERSYYLEKAKLEKEGLDPVSNFFPPSANTSIAVVVRLGESSLLFSGFLLLGKLLS